MKYCSYFLLIFCVLSSINTVCSETDKHVQYNTYFLKGKCAIKNGNYSQATAYFDSASLVFPYFHKPYFEAVICASKLNDYEKAYQYAVKMILTGCHFSIISIETLGEFYNTDYYKLLKIQEDSLYQFSMQKRDTAFANAVIQLYNKNQSKGVSKDTTTFHDFVALCVEKEAFPSYLNVGTEVYRKAYALIYNSYWYSNYPDTEDWQKLLKLMQYEFLSGGIEAHLIALFEETYCRNNNLPLRYGIFSNLFNPSDYMYLPIEELNKNRKEAGLAPIELDAILWDVNLDILLTK